MTGKSLNSASLTDARKLFAMPCEFQLAAAAASQFPVSRVPEVAFVGRSNVGKSSLINSLVNRKRLARASNTPGRTQQIIFFDLGQRLTLVDLPGYGFTNAPPAEKAQWNELVNHYLRQRPSLRCICLLMDGRHGALPNDLEMMQMLDRAAVTYRIIITKADKVKPVEVEMKKRQIEESLTTHPAAYENVLITSSDKGTGMEELRIFLTGYSI